MTFERLQVYDIAFARGTNIFASVGADGSVRMFDLRSLEHSNIIYEDQSSTPLLRLCWNQQDNNYLAVRHCSPACARSAGTVFLLLPLFFLWGGEAAR